MPDCIFCRIASKDIPADILYEDDHMMAFKDIEPQAPVHVLIIPKKHIESMDTIQKEDAALLSHILLKVQEITSELGLKNGYRLVNNCGEDGLQTVQHLHFHLLGARKMQWPPG